MHRLPRRQQPLLIVLRGQLLGTEWNADEEAGSFALSGALRPDRASVQGDELPRDVESEAGAFHPVLAADVPALEALEERPRLIRLEPWPGIRDAHDEVIRLPAYAHLHAALLGVADRVVHDVQHGV